MKMRKLTFAALLGSAAAIAAPAASAAELTRAAEVTRAAVDAAGAEVTRSVTIVLDQGSHDLRLRGLPDGIDAAQVRARIEGDARISSIEVARQVVARASDASRTALEERLADLKKARDAARSREQAAQARLKLVDTMVSSGEGVSRDPEVFENLVALADQTVHKAHDDRAAARRAAAEIAEQIAEVERRLDALGGGARETLVTAGLEVAEAGEITVELTYRSPRARWSPVYEARLDSAGQRLRLVRRARVIQRTGSDWSDVALSLSTQAPNVRQEMPLPGSWRLDFAQPKRSGLLEMGRGGDRAFSPEAAMDMSAQQSRPVTVRGSRFALTFDVTGVSDVPAGGQGSLVDLGHVNYDVALTRRALPAHSDSVFLLGKVEDVGTAPLLAGRSSLYRDGAYAGEIQIPETDAGEPVQLALGRAPGVSVERRTLTDQGGASGIKMVNERKTHTREFQTRITNTTDRLIPVRVVERLPVAGDERIDVEITDGTRRPDVRDLDGRAGVVAWDLDLRPGETRTVPFGYRVSWPPEERIPGF